MRVELICTGEELLSGQTVNTNASWIGEQLASVGIRLAAVHTVGDDMDELVEVLSRVSSGCDHLIVNGGLGPTVDDRCAEAAAEVMNEPLVLFGDWLQSIEQRYAQWGREMPQSNRKQAMLPQSAEIIDNPVGTACGFELKRGRCRLYFTPGVPYELKKMFEQQLLPRLTVDSPNRVTYLFQTLGFSESRLADQLEQITLPKGVVLGYRAGYPTHEIKISYNEASQQNVQPLLQHVRDTLGDGLICEGSKRLTQWIQEAMLNQNQTLALAESCTGGMLANMLIAEAGSSQYLERGYVTYSNQAKQDDLGVAGDVLQQHGAVSLPVVEAMARGACQRAGSSLALAVSGIAGPGGGSDEKPVGTVAFALADGESEEVYSQMVQFPDRGRNWIRRLAAMLALDMLRRKLAGLPVCADYDVAKKR